VITSVVVWISFYFKEKIIFASCFVSLQDLRFFLSAVSDFLFSRVLRFLLFDSRCLFCSPFLCPESWSVKQKPSPDGPVRFSCHQVLDFPIDFLWSSSFPLAFLFGTSVWPPSASPTWISHLVACSSFSAERS
jgi:hypothetical protein